MRKRECYECSGKATIRVEGDGFSLDLCARCAPDVVREMDAEGIAHSDTPIQGGE